MKPNDEELAEKWRQTLIEGQGELFPSEEEPPEIEEDYSI